MPDDAATPARPVDQQLAELAAAWGVGTLLVGFVVFYRAEESYARG